MKPARARRPDEAAILITRPGGRPILLYCKTGHDYEALLVMCNAEFGGPEWIDGPPPAPAPAPPPRAKWR